jgi:predicted nucleic acid-binding Zn ribbon protein
MAPIPCWICHTVFVPATLNDHYCSHACKLEGRRQRRRGELDVLDRLVATGTRACNVCGEDYAPEALNQRYCSRRCAHRAADQAAHNARR